MKKQIQRKTKQIRKSTKGSFRLTPPCDGFSSLRETIQRHFPKLWPAVEAGLSACATLLLADNANPTALIYVGPASAGKTTVASMFDGAEIDGEEFVYRSDRLSSAAFVTHAASIAKDKLQETDLLPRIKDKVLLTPELSTIFKGKMSELVTRLSIITRVLDGQGFSSDSGTHGRRGYRDPHLFAWIGCTTPFTEGIWYLMAQLGSRLVFFSLEDVAQQTAADLSQALRQEVPYPTAVEECKREVHGFLKRLFTEHAGVRGVTWNAERNPRKVTDTISRFALLLATMRGQIPRNPREGLRQESPQRVNSLFYNLARGHALVSGRKRLTEDDLPLVAKIALSSMPAHRRAVLEAFVRNSGEQLTVQAVSEVAHVSRHSAEDFMVELEQLGFAQYVYQGNGRATHLVLTAQWEWCVTGEIGQLIQRVATWQKSGSVFTHTHAQPNAKSSSHHDDLSWLDNLDKNNDEDDLFDIGIKEEKEKL